MMSPLNIEPASSALILVDLQNGVVGRPLAPYSAAQVIERANLLSSAFRNAGATIIFIRVAMVEVQYKPADAPGRDPSAPSPPPEASDLAAAVQRFPTDLVITKRQWGAFYGTELDQMLRRREIRTIVLGGIATNFGVESTAREAHDRDYELIFAEDAMTTFTAEAHEFATTVIFPRMGRVRKTDAVLEGLPA